MAAPTSNPSAFSAFLKAANRRSQAQSPGGSVTADPAARARDAAGDPKDAILAALAGGPLSLAAVSNRTGIALGALIEAIRPLEDYRLLRRVESDDEVVLELTKGGLDMVQAAS